MKKRIYMTLATMMLLGSMTLSACSLSGEKNDNTSNNEKTSEKSDNKVEKKEIGSISDGRMTLGTYKGLEAELAVYKATQDDVNAALSSLLDEYSTEKEVSGKSQAGDYVNVKMTATVNGEEFPELTSDEIDICIGSGEYGDKVDQALVGIEKGDIVIASQSYDDSWDESFANKTVNFTFVINKIYMYEQPELTKDFIENSLGYDSKEDLMNYLKDNVEYERNSENILNTKSDLCQRIIDDSKIDSYPEELYDECKKSIEEEYESYLDWFGADNIQEIYDMFEISQEDIDKEISYTVYTKMVEDAIAKKENISLSDDEYKEYLEEYSSYNRYDNVEDFENDYGEESLREQFLSDKIWEFVYDNSKIKEVEDTKKDSEQEQE